MSRYENLIGKLAAIELIVKTWGNHALGTLLSDAAAAIQGLSNALDDSIERHRVDTDKLLAIVEAVAPLRAGDHRNEYPDGMPLVPLIERLVRDHIASRRNEPTTQQAPTVNQVEVLEAEMVIAWHRFEMRTAQFEREVTRCNAGTSTPDAVRGTIVALRLARQQLEGARCSYENAVVAALARTDGGAS